MVQISINILKNPELEQYKEELAKTIKLVTETLDMMFVFQTEIEVIDLITSDFAALENSDQVTDVQDTIVIAILKRKEGKKKMKMKLF